MKVLKKALINSLLALLVFAGVIGVYSIKAQAAKSANDAANDIDGIFIHSAYPDRLAIEKDGIVLEGYDLTGFNVFIRANNVTVRNCTNATYIKLVKDYKNITVENNTIVGAADNGIIIEDGVSDSTVKNNTITGFTLAGINAAKSSKCVIDGNTINANKKGNHSIFINACSSMTVTNNTINDSAHYGITLKADNGSTVKGNKIINSASGSLSKSMHGDGLLLDTGCNGSQIIGNTIDKVGSLEAHYGNALIVGTDSKNILVKDNIISNAGWYGIQVTYWSEGIKLENNTVSSSKSDGINVSRDSLVDANGNKVFSNGGNGIVFDGHEHKDGKTVVKGTLSKNECYQNNGSGLFVQDANVTLSENNSHNNKESGIRVEGSSTTNISNNTLADNEGHTGLHLVGTSKNTVTSNYIYLSSSKDETVGIRLEQNAEATLTNNRIANFAEHAVYAGENTLVKMSGNQASVDRKTGFQEYKGAYYTTGSARSDKKYHNNLIVREINTSSVKGQTFYNGYTSGAVVDGIVYQTVSKEVNDQVNISVTFPNQANTDKVVMFTVDNDGNSICVNAPKDFKLTVGAVDEEQVKAFVVRFYKEVLGRDDAAIAEDSAGVNDWTNKLVTKEKTGADVAKGFAMSKEFTNKNLGDDAFLKTMYKAFFDREPDEGGYNGWMQKMNNGTSREAVIAGFVNSQEFKNLCAKYGIVPGEMKVSNQGQQNNNNQNNNNNNNNNNNQNNNQAVTPLKLDASEVKPEKLDEYVERLYTKILKRDSEADGKKYWAEVIINGKDAKGNSYDAATAASKGFFNSKEYKNQNTSNEQFVVDCYAAFFNRDPRGTDDEKNYQDWVNQLNEGKITREYMIEKGFGKSKEFKNLLTSYGFKIIE